MIEKAIQDSIDIKHKILKNKEIHEMIRQMADEMVRVFENDGKVLFCGNGGSAADAQHLAAEFSGRFYFDRAPLFSEALHVNTSYLTAVANDYSFDKVYSRLVVAKGRRNDVLVALSTSGNSKNILRAIETANEIGMVTMGLTGESGGEMKNICNYIIRVPSSDTPRIQECHIMLGHILCEIVESVMFRK